MLYEGKLLYERPYPLNYCTFKYNLAKQCSKNHGGSAADCGCCHTSRQEKKYTSPGFKFTFTSIKNPLWNNEIKMRMKMQWE